MRIKNRKQFDRVVELIDDFGQNVFLLPGLETVDHKFVLVAQMIDSIRRIEYLRVKSERARSIGLCVPYSGSFDPLSGAAFLYKAGKLDDAFWLVYLATHFGKHKVDRWNLTEDIYGQFGQGSIWDWAAASKDPEAISKWLKAMYPKVTSAGRSRRFGNHRKFETLKPGQKGTGYALMTYIRWVLKYGSHRELIHETHKRVGQNPKEVYAYLYKDLGKHVAKLGRLGKFDFLCNLSNLAIAPILPDRAYISGATGPKAGAKLLFGRNLRTRILDDLCGKLAEHLDVSPQVIEDALCNWQKNPTKYQHFRG